MKMKFLRSYNDYFGSLDGNFLFRAFKEFVPEISRGIDGDVMSAEQRGLNFLNTIASQTFKSLSVLKPFAAA